MKKSLLLAMCIVMLASSAAFAKTQLTMFYPVAVGGALTKIVDGIVAKFEAANPDIDVKAVYAGNYNDARIKAVAALKAGEPVQTSVLFSIDIFDLINRDLIVPFEDVAKTPEDQAWLKSFIPGLMENGKALGKTWGIPFQRSTIVMYYNKDAFRKAGLDPNTPPATWEELISMGKKLTVKEGGDVKQWGLHIPSTGYPYWMFQALALQNEQALMNKTGNKVFFNSPKSIQALQFWKDLGSKHKIMPEGTIDWGTLRQKFLDGSTAIMFHSTGNLTAVKKNAKFDFGVAMLPAGKRRGSPTGGGNFYIFKKSSDAEKQAALKLIKFMTSPENSAHWSIATGYLAVSGAAYATKPMMDYIKAFPPAEVAKNQLKYASAEFSTYETPRVRKLLDDAIQSALIGRKSPQDALNSAQKAASRVLRKYK